MKKHKHTTEWLLQALFEQPICRHDRAIVDWLMTQKLKAEAVDEGTCIIKQGDKKNKDVFLIVSGRFAIEIGGHFLYDREQRHHVGEMAMIMNEARTASVIAAEDSVVVRIPEQVMRNALNLFPDMWKPIAETLCGRLHQRRTFFRATNKVPRVFLGSSGASYAAVQKLAEELRGRLGEHAIVNDWKNPKIFNPSNVIIQALIEEAKEADFGVFLFAGDDLLSKRGTPEGSIKTLRTAPRDNVVFEGGMFTASCGLHRTFFVCESDSKLQVPSDLAGVKRLSFSRDLKGKELDFGDTVDEIVAAIKSHGVIKMTRAEKK